MPWYEPSDRTVVFIGSSRIKYDLDIPTWESTTGCHAVQLAIEGSSPRPALEDLANDPNFKGRLIVDVTEGLFFSNAPPSMESPNKNIQYFHDRTPAQRASFRLNEVLESGQALLTTLAILKVSVVVAAMLIAHWLMRSAKVLDVAYKLSWWGLGLVWSALLLLLIWAQESSSSFIYFQF